MNKHYQKLIRYFRRNKVPLNWAGMLIGAGMVFYVKWTTYLDIKSLTNPTLGCYLSIGLLAIAFMGLYLCLTCGAHLYTWYKK